MKQHSQHKILMLMIFFVLLLCLPLSHAAAATYPESAHPYAANSDVTWTYTHPTAADYLAITFSSDTQLEDHYDNLIITDEEGNVYSFSGSQLAGKKISIIGDSFTLQLTSDSSVQYYGFAITSITATTEDAFSEPIFTISSGTITGVIGGLPGSVLEIPETVDGQTVTAIGDYAFENTYFSQIILPNTVTHLGHGAFDDCSTLKSVNIPNSVKSIDAYCFFYCSDLQSLTIPDSVTEIGYGAFANCTSLAKVTLPSGLTSLPGYSFHACKSLTSITLPAGITQIQDSTFYECEALSSVTFNATSVSLGDYAFARCPSLTTLNDVLITDIGDYAFNGSPNLVSLNLSDTIDTLPEDILIASNLVLTVGQSSPLLPTLIEHGRPYKIRETGVTYNVVAEGATTVGEKVDDIVAALIRPGMTDYQKALILHDWLTLNANYDYTYSNYSASGVLLKGTGVCQSYALAYQLLMNEVGINNCLEYGDNHVWNMIQLDGEWYHVDVTWDDPGEGGYEHWNFFCLSNYALEGVDSHECYRKTQIGTSYKHNYNYLNGYLDERLEECEAWILTNLEEGNTQFTFTPESFNINNYNSYSDFLDTYDVQNRTAALVVQDTVYEYNGNPVNLTFEYDDATLTFTVTVSMSTPDFTLPAALKTIDTEAFCGISAGVVYLPDGVTSIGSRAFADCNSLFQIRIPASVTSIAADAFENVAGLCIFGQSGSAAETFANAHGFEFCPEN